MNKTFENYMERVQTYEEKMEGSFTQESTSKEYTKGKGESGTVANSMFIEVDEQGNFHGTINNKEVKGSLNGTSKIEQYINKIFGGDVEKTKESFGVEDAEPWDLEQSPRTKNKAISHPEK